MAFEVCLAISVPLPNANPQSAAFSATTCQKVGRKWRNPRRRKERREMEGGREKEEEKGNKSKNPERNSIPGASSTPSPVSATI